MFRLGRWTMRFRISVLISFEASDEVDQISYFLIFKVQRKCQFLGFVLKKQVTLDSFQCSFDYPFHFIYTSCTLLLMTVFQEDFTFLQWQSRQGFYVYNLKSKA